MDDKENKNSDVEKIESSLSKSKDEGVKESLDSGVVDAKDVINLENKVASSSDESLKADVSNHYEGKAKSVRFNKDTRVLSEEKKFLWLNKVLIVFIVACVVVNAVLIFSIKNVLPNIKVYPFYLELKDRQDDEIVVYKSDLDKDSVFYGKDGSFYDVSKNVASYKMSMTILSKYIVDRESLFKDRFKMLETWGPESYVALYSSREIRKNFVQDENYKLAAKGYLPYERVASIEGVAYRGPKKGWIFDVKYSYLDSVGNVTKQEAVKIEVNAKFDVEVLRKNSKDKSKNPLGFKVVKYSYV